VAAVAAITSKSAGVNRRDYDGRVGFTFTLSAPHTLSALGRGNYASNSRVHTVIVVATSAPTVILSSAGVDMGSDPGNDVWTSVTPIVLGTGIEYACLSPEVNEGDNFADTGGVTSIAAVTVTGSVYTANLADGLTTVAASAGQSFGQPNMMLEPYAGPAPGRSTGRPHKPRGHRRDGLVDRPDVGPVHRGDRAHAPGRRRRRVLLTALEIDIPGGDTQTADVLRLQDESTYYFRVRAYNDDGDSDWAGSLADAAVKYVTAVTPRATTGAGNIRLGRVGAMPRLSRPGTGRLN
jgi:hypothetical protein